MHKRVMTRREDRASLEADKKATASLIDELAASSEDAELRQALKSLEGMTMPTDPFWDEAEKCYQSIVTQVVSANEQLVKYLTDTFEVKPELKSNAVLASLIQGVTNDISSIFSRLDAIHARHANKSGAFKTPDEAIECTYVNSDYAEIVELYQVTLLPSINHILDVTGAIDEALAAATAEQAQQLLDPNVVSDVAVREVTQATTEEAPQATSSDVNDSKE